MGWQDMTPRQRRAFVRLNRAYHRTPFIPTRLRRRLYRMVAFLIRGPIADSTGHSPPPPPEPSP